MNTSLKLSEFNVGESLTISDVLRNNDELLTLATYGLFPGANIKIISKNKITPYIIETRGVRLILSLDDVCCINCHRISDSR